MKILFCNIAYMNNYTGNIEEDIPQGGGAWVKENKDAHEKWNFLNINGMCYGFAMNNGSQFHIEKLKNTSKSTLQTDKVTVVWCALKPDGNTVIVGWYENAIVHRYYQSSCLTPLGLDRDYFVEAKADDCYLLPEEKRSYVINRASRTGAGTGFGEHHLWYAESELAKKEIIPSVIEYLNASKSHRINSTTEAYNEPSNIDVPLSAEDDALANQYFNDGEYRKFLPFGYRAFRHNPTADNAYDIATALRETYQFRKAIDWYKKVIEIEGDSWEISSYLPNLLTECKCFEESIIAAKHLLSFDEAENSEVKLVIFSMLADNNYFLGNIEPAISYLDKIIAECTNAELLEHTKGVRENWAEQIK